MGLCDFAYGRSMVAIRVSLKWQTAVVPCMLAHSFEHSLLNNAESASLVIVSAAPHLAFGGSCLPVISCNPSCRPWSRTGCKPFRLRLPAMEANWPMAHGQARFDHSRSASGLCHSHRCQLPERSGPNGGSLPLAVGQVIDLCCKDDVRMQISASLQYPILNARSLPQPAARPPEPARTHVLVNGCDWQRTAAPLGPLLQRLVRSFVPCAAHIPRAAKNFSLHRPPLRFDHTGAAEPSPCLHPAIEAANERGFD